MPTEPIWTPSDERREQSNMRRFIREHAEKLGEESYASLYAWSIDRPQAFWAAAWDFCGVAARAPYARVVDDPHRMPGARWFDGARLNFAENLLSAGGSDPAIVFVNELGLRRELSRAELGRRVAGVAAALRGLGVVAGDRVAGLLPNIPEAVVAMLATSSIGAVWSSCSPDFGRRGVLERFGQIEPKVIFAVDGYSYNGKTIDCREKTRDVIASLPSLAAAVFVSYSGLPLELGGTPECLHFESLADASSSEPEFASLPFDAPLYIVYTSGTTGRPKSIVHGQGGTLIQHKKEHVLHCDVRPGDRMFYFTTTGWMMWQWLVSSLASGATIVLYDGSPTHPHPGALWQMAEDERVTIFGTSAKYLSALEKTGYRPREHHGLESLRTVLSTGSPLAAPSFDYVYAHVKDDLQLSSIAGGTDLISCFVLGNPMLPVYRGEIQCRGLGMKVEVHDDRGNAVTGRKGELVCTMAFPSMPVEFWNDPGGSKYRAAYFERFPGVWCHGDFAELTEHGGMVLSGRSDTVLNPGGVRIGTSEIYRVVEELPEINECIAIDQAWEGDTRIVLFVRMQPGRTLDDAVRNRIKGELRAQASPRHVPAVILEVEDIPRTLSGKIVEVAVRDAVHGLDVTNLDALANPDAIEQFRDRPELS